MAVLRRWIWLLRTLWRSGMLRIPPHRWLPMALAVRRYGVTPLTGLALAAARSPHGTALIDERGSLTWAELERATEALAVGLREAAAGQAPETIGVLCRNHRGFVLALSASLRLGADVLLLNTGFSGPQLGDVMAREGAALIVYDEEFGGLLDAARGQVSGLVEVLGWTEADEEQPSVDALARAHDGERPGRPRRGGRVILLTSGTTGTPKGARRSTGGGLPALAAMLDRIPWRSEETVVVAAPMFHAWGFGQLAIAGLMTCTMAVRRRFDPEATLELADRHRVTGLAVVPVMLERIVDLPTEVLDRHSLAGLRFVTASGSRMRPDAVLAFMDRFGEVVYNSYNATEAGLIATAVPADLRAAPDTAGRPVVGTTVTIVDDDLRPMPTGEVGRILVGSGSHFEGYTSGDGKEMVDGAMVSGDTGRLDAAGRLFVTGRDDEMIVSGGENVYPLEVEQVLAAHPSVREAAVIGVDDEQYGQRLAAFVVPADASGCDAQLLKAFVKERLAGYKVPREVTVLPDLPRNATGKVMKRELLDASD